MLPTAPAIVDSQYPQIAHTWAESLCQKHPELKPKFLEHYSKRLKTRRFWGTAGWVNGEWIAVCRLGENVMLAFYRGQISTLWVHAKSVEGVKLPANTLGPTKNLARFLGALQKKLDPGLITSQWHYDALTSFSKHARDQVHSVISNDIPSSLKVYPGPKGLYTAYYSVSYRKYIGLFGNTLKDFLREVDQDILFSVRSAATPSITLYNWLAGGNRERRLQALRSFPVMVPMEVLLSRDPDYDQDADTFSKIIDNGQPLSPFLVDAYESTKSIIKKAGKLRPSEVGSALSQLKNSYSRHEFRYIIKGCKLGTKRPISKMGWKRFRAALWTNLPMTEANLAGLPTWESDEWRTLTPLIRNIKDTGPLGIKLASKSLVAAISVSRDWHAKREEVQREVLASLVVEVKPYYWPGMLKSDVLHEETGLIFTEILNDVDLMAEGEAMIHCVGGYANTCFDGTSRIISIRDNGKPIATLQYCPHSSGNGRRYYKCVQAYGAKNLEMPKVAWDALTWFNKKLRSFVRSYDLLPVPYSQRPQSEFNVAGIISEKMSEWIETRFTQLGYGELLKSDDDVKPIAGPTTEF